MVLLLFVTGCARRDYNERLSQYEQVKIMPFSEQTLAWTGAAKKGPASFEAESTRNLPSLANLATTSTESARIEVLADVLNLPPDNLSLRLKPFDAPLTRNAALADRLEWGELALAVAFASPAAKAAEERWQAALRQFEQADFLESLVTQYRAFTGSLDVRAGEPFNRAMIQEYFPYPSTITFKGEMIREQARMARLKWEMAVREALVEAGVAYFQFQYLSRAVNTTRENITLIEDVLGVVDQRYRSGGATQADLLRTQTMLERERNMLRDLDVRQVMARAEINAILGRRPDAPLGPPSMEDLPVLVPDPDELALLALANLQAVGMAEVEESMTAIAIRMGEVMNRPLASQGYSQYEPGMAVSGDMGAAETMPYGLSAKSIDRPGYAQAEAYLGELRRRLLAAGAELEQIRANTRSRAISWLQDLDMARRQAALIEDVVIPQNRSAYETGLSAYMAGDMSFVDLLDTERSLLEARLELDAARRDLNQTLIRYANVSGRLPTGSQ